MRPGRGCATADQDDTGGKRDAADHPDSLAQKGGEGRPSRAGPPVTRYGAMRAMCVFQLPSSRRFSG
jgi:hypothetical protein